MLSPGVLEPQPSAHESERAIPGDSTIKPEFSDEELRRFWDVGAIAIHYLRNDQIPVWEFLRSQQDPFLEASRRYGKTTSILTYVLEKLRQHPGWVCRWCEPEKEQARQIVMPEIEKIQETCPEHLQFKFRSTDSVYEGPGGSKLYMVGVNKDRGKSARGSFANIVVADEFGFWTCPEIAESILQPQLLTTRGQFITASTPPEDLGHPYYSKKDRAKRQGRYFLRTIYDNESLTPDDIKKAQADCGGADTPTFRREYLCEEVGDPEARVVPEYDPDRNELPDEHPRPDFFDAYVGGDSGADDNTALLFGYYDFANDWIVIEDELVCAGRPTSEIIEAAKRKEAAHWNALTPYRRVYDCDKQLLIDICSTHKYAVYAPEKTDKIRAIHALRSRVQAGKFKVKKRCVHLRRQLKVGQWRDDKHQDFQRSEELGHLDALAAAVYFNRSVITSRNPVPQTLGLDVMTHFYNPQNSQRREEEEAVGLLLGR